MPPLGSLADDDPLSLELLLPRMFSRLGEASGESMLEDRLDRPCFSVRFWFMRDLLLNRTVARLMPTRVAVVSFWRPLLRSMIVFSPPIT
jgi:hypothetical protein